MRKIREILRLRFGVPPRRHREIATACKISPSTVGDCLARFRASGLTWPLPESLADQELEKRLYRVEPIDPQGPRPDADWAQVYHELRKKHVTLALLWHEYKLANPDGYEYSWFCDHYRAWLKRTELSMRQVHKYGEKCFVDYAGTTMPVFDLATGEEHRAQVFVGVLGASNYTYAQASWSQDLESWTTAHVRMFAFFGGCPEILVPDNLRSGVTKPCHYDPEINPTYQELADHYKVAVIPARKRRPKDKAKVEVGVQLVSRWILAALRNRKFYSLAELNQAIRELLDHLNNRPFKKLPGSRRQVFEAQEKPTLRPLPQAPYELAEFKKAKVNVDYHIELEGHYYSVPYTLGRQVVEARVTPTTVEVLHNGVRVASHPRSFLRGRQTTLSEHMPSHHRLKAEWSADRITSWASKIGTPTKTVAQAIMERKAHPEQGFRSCFGLLRALGDKYGHERLEAACERAVVLKSLSRATVESILKNGLDRLPVQRRTPRSAGLHVNVRGGRYYARGEGAGR